MTTFEPGGDRAMLADMRRQALSLSGLLARADEFRAFGQSLKPAGKGRAYAFGSGDGWFAAQAATLYAREKVDLAYKSSNSLEMLAYVSPDLKAADMAVAISMSGTADRTNQAAEAVAARGNPVGALTNGSGGDLAKIARAKVSLDVTDLAPFLTGTTKYTASLLGLMMILEGVAGRSDADLPAQIAALPDIVRASETFAAGQYRKLMALPPTGVRILSSGCNMATADYGTAKFLKLVNIPVVSDDVEEFAHRQFWSCPATDLVIYIAANPAVARCATGSAAALVSMGMRTIAIDTPDCPVPTAGARLTLPVIGEAVSPLAMAIPLQFLAYATGRALGGNPDISQDVGDPARFHAAQLLSRRGELEPAK
jgi:glucosamine 6-phosphate synthetase-like amidotransferase/phosphosugar isomerase protein